MTDSLKKKKNICDEFQDLVSHFREGNLDEEIQVRFEAHRINCDRCRKALIEEERIAALMQTVPKVTASMNFRDRVLREWRIRRSSVSETIPVLPLKRLQIALYIIIGFLVYLPIVRNSLHVSAMQLTSAFDRLPAESKERIPVTIEIPTYGELAATFQVYQGKLFGFLGNIGASIAPWSGWMWGIIALALIAGIGNYYWMKSKLAVPDPSKKKT